MATGGLLEILDSLGDAVRAIVDDVTDVDVQVEGRLVINPTPPTVDMFPGDISRDADSRGFGEDPYGNAGYLLTCRARVQTADNLAAQDLLLGFMDDTDALSLASAVTEDQTLGGLASSIYAFDPTGYVVYPTADGELTGFQFTVLVIPADS